MDTADIKSFEDFIGVIGSHKKGDITLYRGQNDNYPLLPKIARNDQTKDTGNSERQMLDELRRRGNLYLNGTYDDWELLVLAQHYGMATRLNALLLSLKNLFGMKAFTFGIYIITPRSIKG